MALSPGTQVGRYRVVRMIAQGGMAEVYRAEQELAAGLLRPAAVKVIRPEYAQSPDFREMFIDEARTACTLSHPNIVHIYEVGEADGLLYMAMELVRGESLATVARTLREAGARLSDDALIAVGVFACSALEAVHALKLPGEGHVNLVHRDVSPHNLLLGPSGSLKLIDFGIAKAVSNRNLTSPGITKGKAGYFSPEQAMGKALDGRSDLFSLAVTLYRLASGSTPFEGYPSHTARTQALLRGQWEPLAKVSPGLPPGFAQVVDRALQVRPEDRFVTAREMRESLEQVALYAGMPVGPSALAGYVSESEAGEVQSPPTARTPSRSGRVGPSSGQSGASPGPGSGAAAKPAEGERSDSSRRRTEKLIPRQGGQPPPEPHPLLPGSAVEILEQLAVTAESFAPRRVLAVAALVAVAILVVATLLVRRAVDGGGSEAPPTKVATSSAEPEVKVELRETPQPPPVEPPVATPRVEHQPPPAPARAKARPVRAAVRPAPRPVTAPPADALEVAKAEPIPDGQGVLRIGAVPEGEVKVDGKSYGTTPVSVPIRSGRYQVEIAKPGGARGSNTMVTVLPDRTVRLRYSFLENRWTTE